MKKINITDKKIAGIYTFETSWIGKVFFDIESRIVTLPLLNINVDKPEVLKYFNVKEQSDLYIEHSLLIFEGVVGIEKELAIHSKKKDSFLGKVKHTFYYENEITTDMPFEFGGMGIYENHTFDGMFKVYAASCFLGIPNNATYRLNFKSMNDYNPVGNSWLQELKL